MDLDFEGKAAVVTGAGSGIGAAVAAELATRGARVLVVDVAAEGAETVAAQVRAKGGTAEAFAADVSDAAQVEAMVAKAVDAFGGLHLAVNNAGIGGPQAPVHEYPLDGWRQVMGVNLDGVFYGMKYQIAAMLGAGGGAIVNMSSILGSVGFDNVCAYVTAKHALQGLTRTAALEYGGKGIRVNAVGPGFIETPLVTDNLDAATLDMLRGLHATGRLGRVEEVSAITCFLLSDRASFVNGSYHLVDGGYTAR